MAKTLPDGARVANAIRANATENYKSLVPEALGGNIQEVGNPILKYSSVQNEFLSALVNRIALTIVDNRIYRNPLSILKNGAIPLGQDVQDIYTNPAKSVVYDMEATTELLARTPPDVKAAYHRMNRQDQYPVTISNQALRQAFTSWGDLEQLIASIVNSLYSGDNIDEFILMKNLFGTAINSGFIVKNYLGSAITDETTAKNLVMQVKTTSGMMQFPSTVYNSYNAIATAQGVTTPGTVTTWTPVENQILLIRADILARVDVDVLAAAFNMDKVEFMGRVIPVDNFGTASTGDVPNTVAILADEGWPKVFDNLTEMTEFYNAKSMSWNYYWNHWQTYSYRPFANAVAFVASAKPNPGP